MRRNVANSQRPAGNKPYRWGVLVANTGTPQAPTAAALRDFLEQFLSDPQIIRYPKWFWHPILHGMILRSRPAKSAQKYERIWTDAGSPLLVGTQALARGLEEFLGKRINEPVKVGVGMRYGQPNLPGAYRDLAAQCEQILLLPLFPQHTLATTGSVHDALREIGPYVGVGPYYNAEGYAALLAQSVREFWQKNGRGQQLLISFHGIPMRYARRDPYRAQCAATAQGLVQELGLEDNQWQLCFQSKFGPEPWLKPATVDVAVGAANAGIKRLDVIAPSFAVDCLETLDELGNELRWEFEKHGGQQLHYIPALGPSAGHVELLTKICQKVLQSA